MNRLNGHRPAKRDVTEALDDGDEIARLMRPFYASLSRLAFDDAGDDGLSVAWTLDNPFVQDVIDQLAKQVRRVAETTREDIRRLVGRQADEGWSAEQLAREIRRLGIDASRSRSVTISRTESAAGYSQGSIAAYRDSGVVEQTEWILGPEPCEICQALGGKRAGLGDEYADGITAPPAHPRCTCALVPIVE